jgi:hypothetical protein
MKRNLLISFVTLVVLVVLMLWQGTGLITPQSPRGIIDFEFARTPERFRQLQLFWNHEDVLHNIYVYLLLGIACGWFLVSACKSLANSRSTLFSALSISAAAFNLLENFLMILIWNQRFDSSLLQVVFYAAAVKFLLIFLVVGYLIVSLLGLFKDESPL